MAPAPRLTLSDLPPAARAIASATTDAIAAAQAGDTTAFDDACSRLLVDPEHSRVILGDAVRLLLEDVLPDGVDGDDLRDIIHRSARSAAPWFPNVDPGVMVIVLSSALGIHPDTPPDPSIGERPPEPDDPWDAVPPRPSASAVTQHAVVLLADLLSVRGRPLRRYLEAAFSEMARRETFEQP